MLNIPLSVLSQYTSVLKKNKIDAASFADYRKWLRYYFDFSNKYPVPDAKSECVRLFCEKLREKRQDEQQRQQAAHAVSLFIDMDRRNEPAYPQLDSSPSEGEGVNGLVSSELEQSTVCEPTEPWAVSHVAALPPLQQSPFRRGSSHYCAAGYEEKTDSPEWDAVLAALAAEITVRHYSRKTLKTYALWSRHFQRFLKNKPPEDLSTADVKEYLTCLAVMCHVAASTQNQAS